MDKKFILLRSIGIIALSLIAFLFPATGENHKLLAGVLFFIALPTSVLVEIYFPVRETGWSEILFDLICIVSLVHIIPESWSVIFLIGALLIGASGVMASRIGYQTYAWLMVLLIFGMSFAGYIHQVDGWLWSILIVTAILPAILFFVREENKRIEKLYEDELSLKNLSLLAGGIAHDFNNILTAIIGNLELARLELPENSGSAEFVEDAYRATRRAGLLSGQLLSFAGRKTLSKVIIDFPSELKSIANLTERMLEKGITFTFADMPQTCFIECDEAQIQQVVMNILLNAGEASTSPSSVSISLTLKVDSSSQSWAILEVHDKGSGISEDLIGRIFDPFISTKATGHGLGLASARRIVESHGGEISVESTENIGTTIGIKLPAVSSNSLFKIQDEEEKAFSHSGLILVIDDDEQIRNIAKRFLEKLGYSTMLAKDGYEGLELFEKHSDEVSCILLDLKMPGKDGWQCLKEIREISPDMSVVISSGYNPSNKQIDEKKVTFLSKPYTRIELENAFYSLLTK